jgi:hypothetical protein
MSLSWDEVASQVIERLSDEERTSSVVYVDERVLPAGSQVDVGGRTLELRRPSVLAFVDLEPALNWGHRCRYELVGAETGDVEAFDAAMPPFLRGMPQTMRVVWPRSG